jgi:hypothetical protein
MKPIVLSEQNWAKLRFHLMETQPKSVMLTRWKMRKVLGFTVRHHRERVDVRQMTGEFGMRDYGVMMKDWICLDFYDEAKKTMFLLKYSDWIKSEDIQYR